MEKMPDWLDPQVKYYVEDYEDVLHADVMTPEYGVGVKFTTKGVDYLTFNRETPREIRVRVDSWIGLSPEAIHCYAKIAVSAPYLEYEQNGVKQQSSIGGAFDRPKETDDIDLKVKRYLTRFEKENDPDRWEAYRAGRLIDGFEDEAQLYEYTLSLLKARFSGKWKVSIEGFSDKKYNKTLLLKNLK